MPLAFKRLHPTFFAEASPVALREVYDLETLDAIRAAMDEHAVLVFHEQAFTDAEQLDFARRLDGALHARTGARVVAKSRLGDEEALTDISNVGADGALLASNDRQRLYRLGNRLWHTDASFEDPAGRYSMLHARVVPPAQAGGDTEFADMRAAYDALSAAIKARLEGLRVRHSIAYSRQTLGFEFTSEEAKRLPGAEHPLVRTLPRAGRRSLYLASHAAEIV
ncbi:MAG TPA: TauD/TfdA family dioxygenase, partial [Burkholderiales bacterium]|nr:TauD/TfdA family dioxygenase [Burkholderiales bacterium]